MKIAYILKMYPRFSETFIINEILELERRGVDVRIYSLRKPDDGRFHAELARVKANVIYVPQYPEMEPDRIRLAHKRLQQAVPDQYAELYAQTRAKGARHTIKRFLQAGYVAEHLLRNPVHAVHAHFATSATRVANLVYQLIGLPYSFTAHAKDIYHQSVQPGSLRRKMADARFVVTVSEFNRDHLYQIMGDKTADIRTLYNGIDLFRFQPDPMPRPQHLILGVGRLVDKKGWHTLIDACQILDERGYDFECHIVGKGEKRAELQAKIETNNLDHCVKLVGAKPQDGVKAAYQRATIFALPCVVARDGNRDGLPTVLLEAMASGLPVVSTKLTGIPEIIDHLDDGLLVPPSDVYQLANILGALMQDEKLRQRLGAAARKKVTETFDIERNVAQLHAWLAEEVEPSPNSSHWEGDLAPLPVGEAGRGQTPRVQTLINDLTLPPFPPSTLLEEVFAAL